MYSFNNMFCLSDRSWGEVDKDFIRNISLGKSYWFPFCLEAFRQISLETLFLHQVQFGRNISWIKAILMKYASLKNRYLQIPVWGNLPQTFSH